MNKQASTSKKKLRIACSNFENEKKEYIQGLVKNLGGIYDEHLEYDTDILIAANSLSLKHRSAHILGIPVVTSKWIYKSVEKSEFLPVNAFLLPFFHDLKFGVLGYSSSELDEIKKIIDSKGGIAISNLNDLIKDENVNFFVMKLSEFKTYESFLNSKNIMVVNENWLKACLNQNTYIRPEAFLINCKSNSILYNLKESYQQEIMLLQQDLKLKRILNHVEIDCKEFSYLHETLIYFHNISENLEKHLKNIVNLGGGFYCKFLSTKITHIVTENYDMNDFKNFRNISSNIFILHPLWLKDCYKYKRKIIEIEYYLEPNQNLQICMSIENKAPPLNLKNPFSFLKNKRSLSSINGNGFNGKSFMEVTSKTDSFEIIRSDKKKEWKTPRKSSPKKTVLTPSKKEIQIQIKSFLFQNVFFHINISDLKELKQYRLKILEHSGKFCDAASLLNSKNTIYYVLPDKTESLVIKRQAEPHVICISYRWIDYCVEKKQIMKNFLEQKLIHLGPFPHKMPVLSFKNICVFVVGFPTHEKIILKSLLGVMGGDVVYDKNRLTHLICENPKSKKYLELKNNNKIKILKSEWVFECLQFGKLIEDTKFLFTP